MPEIVYEREKMNDIRLTWKSRRAGILLAFLFFSIGIMMTRDFGVTLDEGETTHAGRRYIEIFPSILNSPQDIIWPHHELTGYSFIMDSWRAGAALVLSKYFHSIDFPTAFHLTNLFLSSLSIYFIFMIALMVSQNQVVAFFSALSLALLPQFVAHSQNNPKDLPALFVFVLSIYFIIKVTYFGQLRDILLGSIALGVAWTTHCLSILAVPVTLLWILLINPSLAKIRLKKYGILFSISVVLFFIFWPWLWDEPIAKLMQEANLLLHFHFQTIEVYLGELYPAYGLPWHYFIVNFLAFTPTLYLLMALVSISLYARENKSLTSFRSLETLGLLWCVILVYVEATSASRYNSLRHFMVIFPGFCLLVGLGMEILFRKTEEKFGNYFPIVLSCVLWGFSLFQIIRMHPYEGAYLNEVTNILIPKEPERYFSVEYFAQTYKEGSNWLNTHAEKEAEIYVPVFGPWANQYLIHKSTVGHISEFVDTTKPRYLMYLTKVSKYNDLIRLAESNYEPVFEIKRQNATLLKIFKNTNLKTGNISN